MFLPSSGEFSGRLGLHGLLKGFTKGPVVQVVAIIIELRPCVVLHAPVDISRPVRTHTHTHDHTCVYACMFRMRGPLHVRA